MYGTAGAYTLTVKPLHSYDSYEPNDSVLRPSVISAGRVIDAGLMDTFDADFYQVRVAANKVSVNISNKSTTLVPGGTIFDAGRNQIASNNSGTSGADFDLSAETKAGEMYFVKVWGMYSWAGAYAMTVR